MNVFKDVIPHLGKKTKYGYISSIDRTGRVRTVQNKPDKSKLAEWKSVNTTLYNPDTKRLVFIEGYLHSISDSEEILNNLK